MGSRATKQSGVECNMYRMCWVANRPDGPGRTTGSVGRKMSRTARQKNSGRQAGIRTRDDQGEKRRAERQTRRPLGKRRIKCETVDKR